MNTIKNFGKYMLDDTKLKRYLSPVAFARYVRLKDAGEPLDEKTANALAKAIKKWANNMGATHYAHWFMPLTHKTAEKQTSFVEVKNGKIITDFCAKDLIKGETDASSFPSGGERATFEARGYTIWDYTSPIFIKEDAAGNKVMYIPTAFCGYNGVALDEKTPLLRALEALSREAVNMLHILGYNKVKKVNLMTGLEQEYFLIKSGDFNERTDLKTLGRTLFGARPLKSQELCSHYFGNIENNISAFMHEASKKLWQMGVTAKHQHNEVAPCQFEFVPIFSPANIAADQNYLIMQTLSSLASEHGLSALFAEKPFAYINGSGKHCNWSLETDTGINLFDSNMDDKLVFYTFFVAVVEAIDRYNSLIKLCASSRDNDLRLGASEAPPSIVSIYAGSDILSYFADYANSKITNDKMFKSHVKTLPQFEIDTCDRNRTSPFAYAGKKFEFRMLGSSMSASFASTCFCAALSKVLSEYAEKSANVFEKRKTIEELLKNQFEMHKKIMFNGNNYSKEWHAEAKKRGFETYETSLDIFEILDDKNVVDLFESTGVLSKTELALRKTTMTDEYKKTILLEAKTMLNMMNKEIIPTMIIFKNYLINENLTDISAKALPLFEELLEEHYILGKAIEEYDGSASKIKTGLLSSMSRLRASYDALEELLPAGLEPFPTYNKILL